MSLIPLKNSTNSNAPRWIVLVLIVLAVCLSKNLLRAQTPTKNRAAYSHVTISELAARNALRYKLDAEYWYQVAAKKDTIIAAQDTIIKAQKKKVFWKSAENWGWRALALATLLKLAIK
ncbi:hypothetical protein FHS57_006224 [Runella defluvii]|uniref:Uncharacterized protein n=1 Tax=Runella defluvii TaxID=370973 RepID=A0A7W5ZR99_9BACT|nr:hypothetical protein [Runella defluvii]MBB3842193.1 hypothetical protein [Runella defluvii]